MKVIKMICSRNFYKSYLKPLRADFQTLVNYSTAAQGLQKLVDDYTFSSVLDIGAGEGLHSQLLTKYGKKVTAIDYGRSIYYKKNKRPEEIDYFYGDFNEFPETELFDCAWCSHVLEHQLNINLFLTKINRLVKEGGVIAITVPPLKQDIVGGHFTLWNAGILLYNLVMAGFDCSNPSILKYGYNITVIIRKRAIRLPPKLSFDAGDLELLSKFFPHFVKQGFDGDIYEYNWYE
ncbi:class I SAM-dependent methyltransferase [Paraglaciecola sp. 2405UD69-4]|uniref:class I SAM-dependent methyltransferase n=1 Tax=Paraglaciecola sp. 2405UD69-4 TaxID=3391836 RepID=UPI0039C8D352